MKETATHAGHPEGTAQMRYPEGRLGATIAMIKSGKLNHALAQQFQALARVVANHMDHCLDTNGADQGRAEPAAIPRYH